MAEAHLLCVGLCLIGHGHSTWGLVIGGRCLIWRSTTGLVQLRKVTPRDRNVPQLAHPRVKSTAPVFPQLLISQPNPWGKSPQRGLSSSKASSETGRLCSQSG